MNMKQTTIITGKSQTQCLSLPPPPKKRLLLTVTQCSNRLLEPAGTSVSI